MAMFVTVLYSLISIHTFTRLSGSPRSMCTDLENFSHIESKNMLVDGIFETLITDGLMTCSKSCLLYNLCKSFNFNPDTGECQLLSDTVESTDQLRSSWKFMFSDIKNWPQELAGTCARHSCPLNTFCDPDKDELQSCVPFGCLNSTLVEEKLIGAQELVSAIGTNVKISCAPPYVSTRPIRCQPDGTWSASQCAFNGHNNDLDD